MAFNFKQATKTLGTDAMDVGLMIGGAVAAKKFLDFSNIFKNQKEDSAIIKYQGGIKLVGGLVGRGMVKNKYVKNLLTGVAFEGGLSLLRNVTMKDGKSFFEPIGNEDDGMEGIKDIDKEMERGVGENYEGSVGGVGDAEEGTWSDL